MVVRFRRFLYYGIGLAVAGTVFMAVVLMRADISRSLDRKAELVIQSNKKLNEKVDPKIVEKKQEDIEIEQKKMDEKQKAYATVPTSVQFFKQSPNEVVEDKRVEEKKTEKKGEKVLKPDTTVHIFYYPWYGNPAVDNGSYYHWNHRYLPHWDKKQDENWPHNRHSPPDDIASNFFPKLGCYSSRDLSVIHQHMLWMKSGGIGVVVVSWYPPGLSDDDGHSWDDIMPKILDSAAEFKLKVAFHIEPYKDRNINTLKENVSYILKNYGDHSAFYYYQHMGRNLPLFYIYDSYLIPDEDWQTLLAPKGVLSIRGTKLDAFYIGLLVKEQQKTSLLKSGFDGFYTYFAADSFSYGSTWLNWPAIRVFAKKNRLIFIPSVGPGYIDVRIRPWNKVTTRPRLNGTTYQRSFESAIKCHADILSITSFNEWHEGTQIEPAVPKETSDSFKYADYSPMGPEFYLNLTRIFVTKWMENQSSNQEVEKSQNVAAAVIQ